MSFDKMKVSDIDRAGEELRSLRHTVERDGRGGQSMGDLHRIADLFARSLQLLNGEAEIRALHVRRIDLELAELRDAVTRQDEETAELRDELHEYVTRTRQVR